jgi:hypothetical protein
MREKTGGFKPLGLAAGNDGYGYLASSKTLPRTHTSLSPLPLSPHFPPTSPSLSSLSLSRKQGQAQAGKQAAEHTPKGLRKLYIGQIDTGRMDMPGIFHKHAKYTLHTRALENQRWVFVTVRNKFITGRYIRADWTCPGFSISMQSTHTRLHT